MRQTRGRVKPVRNELYQNLTIFVVNAVFQIGESSCARKSSLQAARLNLVRSEAFEGSRCTRLRAMCRKIAKLYALLSLRFRVLSSFMTVLRTQCSRFSTPQWERAT